MKEVSNPHDAIFKAILSRRDAAQSFLATYLPPALTAVLDVQSAELEKDSFVDEELRASYSDLVYSVNLKDGRSLCVYVLFEHKSEPEPLVAFHLIRYMVRLWEDSLKQGKRIRPIIPLVVYHGSASWSPAKRFHDLLDVPDELKPFVPDYRYILTDFSHMPDEEIGGNTLVRVFSVVLKYTFREDISEKLVLITMTLRELMSWQDGMSLVATFLRYLAMSGARISREELRKAVKKALPKEGERIMSSIAQEWFEEGRQQGMLRGIEQGVQRGIEQGVQRGIEQGVLEGLHKSIALGLELKFAADGLRLLPEIRKIADRDVLEAIYEGIKTVNSTADLRRIYKRRRRG